MNKHRLLSTCLLLACGAAAAAPVDRAAVQQRYVQERAVCTSGRSSQERSVCLKEAGAARAEALRGSLAGGSPPYAANASARCAALKGDDIAACQARMSGQGTVSGSVAGGGLLRELVTVQPAASAPR